MIWLYIEKDNRKAKILCGSTDQLFELILAYKADGYKYKMVIE